MNQPIHTNPNNLETYFEELLDTAITHAPASPLPSLSKYAIVLEGEQVNVALLLENFAGVADPQRKTNEPTLSVDALVNQYPKLVLNSTLLRVKIKDFPVSLACKRVETIIDLHESNLVFHYDESKPWSAGMIKTHWAILLDITKLPIK